MRKEFHPRQEVAKLLEGVFTVMRQEILAAHLPEHLQNSLLSHLRGIDVEKIPLSG
jgi:hypothetical protein